MMKQSRSRTYLHAFFDKAVAATKVSGHYHDDLAWQMSRDPQVFTENYLLRETAWVILNSGFRNTVARKVWPGILCAFFDFESAEIVVRHRNECIAAALNSLRHREKIEAMATVAGMINQQEFDKLKARILANPIPVLREFPFIGGITVYHLAKDLGFQVAKPDRHLVRMSLAFGFGQDVQAMCREMAEYSGLPINCVDMVLWRYASLGPGYQEELPRG